MNIPNKTNFSLNSTKKYHFDIFDFLDPEGILVYFLSYFR